MKIVSEISSQDSNFNHQLKYFFMETTTTIKVCLSCSKKINGRADKKYCDDFCRNSYNNHLKGQINNVIRNVNNALLKNRRILESLLPPNEEMKMVGQDRLIRRGFRLKHHTHLFKNHKGQTYFFCYDYGYLITDKEGVLIVKSK